MELLNAGDRFFAFVKSLLRDLVSLSPSRTAAIAWLSIKESIRKQASAGLIIFLVILAFALWFLDNESIDPSSLYIGFVLNAVNYLVLLLALVTSTFSLPNDVKNKTIYTIVTKPVRPSEIVLGRILGFTAVCTVPLVLMSVGSYFFVVRSLDHRHELTEADLSPVPEDPTGQTPAGSLQGTTSAAQNHRHNVVIGPDGHGVTETNDTERFQLDKSTSFLERFGHTHFHEVFAEDVGGKRIYHVGPPLGQFHARVPLKGTLNFKDKDGVLIDGGYNVGNWTKRGYVAGGTLSAAIFDFHDVTPELFPDGLRLQLDIRLFRTTKADLNKPLLGSIVFRNKVNGLTSAPRNFAAREYVTLDLFIPRLLSDTSGNQVDLFQDLVVNGDLEMELQCIPRSQFFGVGPDDVYLLAREGRFDVNFAKGCVGIWLQMVLTIVLGTFFSTFLSGPVAMLATFAAVGAAQLRPFLLDVVNDNLFGGAAHTGGVFESTYRIASQRAITLELEPSLSTTIIQWIDRGLNSVMELFLRAVPDFTAMNDVDTVASGFDVPMDLIWWHVTQTLLFALPLFILALVVFKLREVAK